MKTYQRGHDPDLDRDQDTGEDSVRIPSSFGIAGTPVRIVYCPPSIDTGEGAAESPPVRTHVTHHPDVRG